MHCREAVCISEKRTAFFFVWILQHKETDVCDERRAVVKERWIILLDTDKNRLDAVRISFPPPRRKDVYCTRAMNYNWTDISVSWTKQHVIQGAPEKRQFIKFVHFVAWEPLLWWACVKNCYMFRFTALLMKIHYYTEHSAFILVEWKHFF
jgi:hypothetical protein